MAVQYCVSPLSRADIRLIVGEFRKLLLLQDKEYFPVVEILDVLSLSDAFEFNYCVESCSVMGALHGETIPGENLVRIREDVYDGAAAGKGRDRFTIAHELGHWLLHDTESISFARANIEAPLPAFRDPEWQANEFSAELLMPAKSVKGISVMEITRRFGVTTSAAEVQWKKLNKK